MRAQFLVSTRFLRPRNKKSIFSLMSIVSMLGITLGVMIPVVVLSVLVGFQEEIKSKILGVKGHLIITKGNNGYIKNYEKLIAELKKK